MERMDHHEIEGSGTDMEQAVPTLTTKIGGTTYVVGVHFSKTSRETLQDKIKRMAAEEGGSGKFKTDFD